VVVGKEMVAQMLNGFDDFHAKYSGQGGRTGVIGVVSRELALQVQVVWLPSRGLLPNSR
jgi:hypothetical protein